MAYDHARHTAPQRVSDGKSMSPAKKDYNLLALLVARAYCGARKGELCRRSGIFIAAHMLDSRSPDGPQATP